MVQLSATHNERMMSVAEPKIQRLTGGSYQDITGHFSLIAVESVLSWGELSWEFLAFEPVVELQQDVADDRPASSPFVPHFF